jgi:hypothetical protein
MGQGLTSFWGLGYSSFQPDTLFGGMTLKEVNNQMVLFSEQRKMNFFESNASISDNIGQQLFYSNGIWIANSDEDTMLNGNDLNPSWFTDQWSFWGMRIPQGDIILPMPGDTSRYYLFHETVDIPTIYYPNKLYVTTVDMQGDSGRGAVTDKNKIILNDTLIAGSLTACKHANGRDWWLVVPEYGTELGFYTFLITPDTIQQYSYMKANANGIGRMQSCFSPDGSKYIISTWVGGMAFYDFDRCSGSLTFNDSVSMQDGLHWFGASISPKSRYGYTCGKHGYDFYQFDLQATDISASKMLVAQWDTFSWPPGGWWTAFYMQQLAPDGKIYIECPGTTMAMHILENPDSAGTACDLQQHAMLLPHFNATIPNFPNYDLGRLQGSPCDTLLWTNLTPGPSPRGEGSVLVNPNPASNSFNIRYDIATNQNMLFVLYDSYGKEVLRKTLYGTFKNLLVHTDMLSDGVYFYSATVEKAGIREAGKLVIVH